MSAVALGVGETDSGFYSLGANDLNISAGGTQAMRFVTTSIQSTLPHGFVAGSVSAVGIRVVAAEADTVEAG